MNPFSKLFRRKRPTLKQGRAIIQKTIKHTLESGLQGYVIADLSEDDKGEIIAVINAGNFGLGMRLSKFLTNLLYAKETRNAAMTAIIAALKETGSAQEVRIPV